MATTFKVDQEELEVDRLLRNLDRQKDAYISSMGWDADKQKAFINDYNRIRAGIADGTITGRNSDRSYADSTQSIQNSKDGYDSVGEVFHYIDQVLDARPTKASSSSGKKDKYSNTHLLQSFVNDQFGGNTALDLKAWDSEDLLEDGTYKLDKRKGKMIDFLTRYRDNLGDFDYAGTAYKDKEDLTRRLDAAINAMQTTDNWDNELGALGFNEEFRNTMFRTNKENAKTDDDLLRESGMEWAIGLSPEQKAEVLADVKAGKGNAANANYETWKKGKEEEAENKEWEEFLKNTKTWMPDTQSRSLTYDRTQPFFDIGDNNHDLDVKSILKGYGKASLDYNGLRNQFTQDLVSYMSGDNKDTNQWASRISDYNNRLGISSGSNDDYRRSNRFVTGSYWTESFLNPWYNASFDDQYWNDKHFVDNYQALIQHEQTQGGNNIVNGSQIGLGENEYYLKGMWNPEKFEFYTYDSSGKIQTHRIDESPEMLKEWKAAGYFKNRNNPEKKQDGGIIFSKEKQPKSDGLTDEQRLGMDESYNRKKAGERVVADDLRPEDFVRFGAMGADVAALVASFAPGYGTAASGVLGLGSTVADLTADIMDESVSAGQVFTNLGANLGMAALGLIPGGKSASLAGKIAKWVPRIVTAAAAGNVALNDDIHKSLGKLTSGDDITVNDWRNIGIALSTVSGLSRAGTAAYKARKFKTKTNATGEVEVKLKNADGVETKATLTKDQLSQLNNAKSNEEATNILKSFNLKDKDGKAVFTFKDKDGKDLILDLGFTKERNIANLYGLRRKKITGEELTNTDYVDPQRIAYEKALSRYLDIHSKGKLRLATDYEVSQGKGYVRNLDIPMPNWIKNLTTNKNFEEYKANQTAIARKKEALQKAKELKALKKEAREANKLEKQRTDDVKNIMQDLSTRLPSSKITKQHINEFKRMFPTETAGMSDYQVARLIAHQRVENTTGLSYQNYLKGKNTPAPAPAPVSTPKPKKPLVSADPYTRTRLRNNGKFSKKYVDKLTTFDNGSLTRNAADYFRSLALTKYKTNNRVAQLLGIDPNSVNVSFRDRAGNIYYWQDGGVVKHQQGGPIGSHTTSKIKAPVSNNSNGLKKSDVIDTLRLYKTQKHNAEMSEMGQESLRKSYTQETPFQKQTISVRTNLPKLQAYDKAAEATRATVQQNLTSDATTNALLQLTGQQQVNDYNIQKGITAADEVAAAQNTNQQIVNENAQALHAANENEKLKRGALTKALYDIRMGAKATNQAGIDAYLKGKQSEAQLDESRNKVRAENLEYSNYAYNLGREMQNKLDKAKATWLTEYDDKGNLNVEDNWLESSRYKQLYDQYDWERNNSLRQYQSNLYGVQFTPVQKAFIPTYEYKKGGKTKKSRKIEAAKLLNKDIIEQLKINDRKLDRLSKVTQKAIEKALGL